MVYLFGKRGRSTPSSKSSSSSSLASVSCFFRLNSLSILLYRGWNYLRNNLWKSDLKKKNQLIDNKFTNVKSVSLKPFEGNVITLKRYSSFQFVLHKIRCEFQCYIHIFNYQLGKSGTRHQTS